jgi:hypothetical protein
MFTFHVRLTPRHFTAQLLETQCLPDLASGQILQRSFKASPNCFCLRYSATTRFYGLKFDLKCEKSGCDGTEGFELASVDHHFVYQALRF